MLLSRAGRTRGAPTSRRVSHGHPSPAGSRLQHRVTGLPWPLRFGCPPRGRVSCFPSLSFPFSLFPSFPPSLPPFFHPTPRYLSPSLSVHARARVHVRARTFAGMSVSAHSCDFARSCVCVRVSCVCLCVLLRAFVRACVRVRAYVCMRVRACANVRVRAGTFARAFACVRTTLARACTHARG